MAMAASSGGRWKRVRTLGKGASGAEVFLAADDASGELFAVKSASAAMGAAATLRREQGIMAGLRSPNVLSCIGGHGGRDGSYQLFLEFAPGGSLADGGRLEERAVRAYAADVATGLSYLHGDGLVHGDVKPRNVVIGGDGRAKLADFGCSRKLADSSVPILGGTPAFMAPEVARGEEQGPAADIWALGCTVVEMATGRAPWNGTGMESDLLAALHRIGYTDAVPQVPQWLSPEAKDFLARCLIRRPGDRCTAAQLLEHPFLCAAGKEAKREWVSPKSTLDAAFWETDADEEEEEEEVSVAKSTAERRIRALACPASSLPGDWDSDKGWIDVLVSAQPQASDDAAPLPTLIEASLDRSEESSGEASLDRSEESSGEASLGLHVTVDSSDTARGDVGEAAIISIGHDRILPSLEISSLRQQVLSCKLLCDANNSMNFVLAQSFRFLFSIALRAISILINAVQQ